ncbi:restriction endonuclease subunit S [Lutibacter sp.]|uniref:restriction endonuclease subunit S n=1 Tax=Lutibacter sp. TaxID=1925666 RepID=UPI00356722AA
MNKFITTTVEEVAENFDNIRVPLSSKQRKDLAKIFPYYGAQSIIDYVDDFLFDGEYILVAEDGENLKSQNSNVCNLVNGKFWVNNHAHIIKGKDGNNTKYLCYYLNLMNFKPFVTGSAQPKLTKDNLNSIPLKIHNKLEQKQIAKVLSDLDAKIEINNKINQELEAMAKTIYDYWFVQFDFPDANGKPYKSSGGQLVYNEVLKREIPEGWSCNLLGNLGNFKNGVNYDPSNPGEIACPIINVRNISKSSYFLKNEDLDIIYLSKNDVRKYAVHKGSIIIARSGIPGATRLIADFEENTLYCGFAIHYELEDLDQKNPIFFYLKSIEELIKNGSGGTILKNVNQATLNNLKIVLPKTKEIIESFNKNINPIFSKINLIQKENQKLSELRDWLLPMLMNGQVSITNKELPITNVKEQLGMVAEDGEVYNKF